MVVSWAVQTLLLFLLVHCLVLGVTRLTSLLAGTVEARP